MKPCLLGLYVFGLASLLSLAGCSLPEKLSTIGEPPKLSQIQNPTQASGYQPISMPMPASGAPQNKTNSLWQTGSRAFFKDQRANKVGDVVTVIVSLDQKQSIQMTPQISRQSSGSTTVNNVMGFERKAEKLFPKKQQTTPGTANPSWLSFSSDPSLTSTAQYDVQDQFSVRIAATIIQILPNGNMVIMGRQELRLVNEAREIEVKGIVRKEDISSSNTVTSDKIAEMRLAYGGRGELTDMQSFPWGQQIINKVMPF
jgi:flagellar L-ring protein precursor FlgH